MKKIMLMHNGDDSGYFSEVSLFHIKATQHANLLGVFLEGKGGRGMNV